MSTGETGLRSTEHLDDVLESFYAPRRRLLGAVATAAGVRASERSQCGVADAVVSVRHPHLDFLVGPLRVDKAASRAATRSEACPSRISCSRDFNCRHGGGNGGGAGGGDGVRGQCLCFDFGQPRGRGNLELLRVVGSKRTATLRVLASDGLTVEAAAGAPAATDDHAGENDESLAPATTTTSEWLPLPPPEHMHNNLVQSSVNELLATRRRGGGGEGAKAAADGGGDGGGGGGGGGGGTSVSAGLGLVDVPCVSTGETGLRFTEHLDDVLKSFYAPRRRLLGAVATAAGVRATERSQ